MIKLFGLLLLLLAPDCSGLHWRGGLDYPAPRCQSASASDTTWDEFDISTFTSSPRHTCAA